MKNPPAAQFEILIDGKPRSYRDIKAVAMQAAHFSRTAISRGFLVHRCCEPPQCRPADRRRAADSGRSMLSARATARSGAAAQRASRREPKLNARSWTMCQCRQREPCAGPELAPGRGLGSASAVFSSG
jgi:hypothetical protein